jgi:hypothetical protein
MGQDLFHHGQNNKETDFDKMIHADVTNHYDSDGSNSWHITVQSKYLKSEIEKSVFKLRQIFSFLIQSGQF